jgi:hypothetical protein
MVFFIVEVHMFKFRSVLIAVALVALLSVASWQASFASSGDKQPNTLGTIQSYAPAAVVLRCNLGFEPNEEGTECICPRDYKKLTIDGRCIYREGNGHPHNEPSQETSSD